MSTSEKPYDFKRKRYGYGWVPTTLAGWLYILIFAGIAILAGNYFLGDESNITLEKQTGFFVVLGIDVALLFFVTSKTAPHAKWRWGKKEGDDPKADY